MDFKNSNEITLKVEGSTEDFKHLLEERGYKITEKFYLYDIFMIEKEIDLQKLSSREILSKALLIRRVGRNESQEEKLITFKKKEFDDKGNILNQSSINLKVDNIETAEKLLNAIGFERIMEIREHDTIYRNKDDFGIALKEIEGEDTLIEIETERIAGYETIEDLIKWVKEEKFPLDYNNFFVKKAEIALDKVLKKNRK